MSIERRLRKLESARASADGPCDPPGAMVLLSGDEPIPADAAKCPGCGRVHVVRIVEDVIVPIG